MSEIMRPIFKVDQKVITLIGIGIIKDIALDALHKYKYWVRYHSGQAKWWGEDEINEGE